MNTPTQESMFEITLSQQGAKDLLRVYRLARWIIIVISVVTILYVSLHSLRGINYYRYKGKLDWFYFIEIRIMPFITVLFTLTSFVMNYQYFRFAAICKRGIETGDSEMFNSSIKLLIRNNKIALTICIIEIVLGLFYLYHEIIELIKASNPA
jgi:hypothetical protein